MDVRSGEVGTEGSSEMDSHADTTATGNNMVMLTNPDEVMHFVDLAPLSEEYAPMKGILIATCATAWTNPENGQVFILAFHEILYFGNKLAHSLICPNQIRACAFHRVDEAPRQWDPASSHGIALLSDNEDNDELFISLEIKGVISYFNSRKPTEEELRTWTRIVSTADTPWDPNTTTYSKAEDAMKSVNPREVSDMNAITDDEYDMYDDC